MLDRELPRSEPHRSAQIQNRFVQAAPFAFDTKGYLAEKLYASILCTHIHTVHSQTHVKLYMYVSGFIETDACFQHADGIQPLDLRWTYSTLKSESNWLLCVLHAVHNQPCLATGQWLVVYALNGFRNGFFSLLGNLFWSKAFPITKNRIPWLSIWTKDVVLDEPWLKIAGWFRIPLGMVTQESWNWLRAEKEVCHTRVLILASGRPCWLATNITVFSQRHNLE